MRNLILFVLMFLMLLSSNSFAKTWYIKSDGYGDAPTIKAGVHSCVAGDTVLVAAGQYEFNDDAGTYLKNGLVVISESGPLSTILIGIPSVWPTRAFYGHLLTFDQQRNEINGFWFKNFDSAIMLDGGDCLVKNNIFSTNIVGLTLSFESSFSVENNTFYNDTKYAIDASNACQGSYLLCNIIWGQAIGLNFSVAFSNVFFDLADSYPYQSVNISVNPEFCGETAGNFFLQSDSPCAPSNNPIYENHLDPFFFRQVHYSLYYF